MRKRSWVVGILVGPALLWDRLRGRERSGPAAPGGWVLLLSVFGLIAIVVGLQGLFTSD